MARFEFGQGEFTVFFVVVRSTEEVKNNKEKSSKKCDGVLRCVVKSYGVKGKIKGGNHCL